MRGRRDNAEMLPVRGNDTGSAAPIKRNISSSFCKENGTRSFYVQLLPEKNSSETKTFAHTAVVNWQQIIMWMLHLISGPSCQVV
ncbi:hypothetical protein F2P81_004139 [Scophthalmus maximus]|uniref:Uncharacterized protein n=1 Tax=Scophthalmus maximus TaxID=52904 RepID=A0A6A4TLD1_SCOMX|nr:hypothetical protein F2P81_004139 [Scophthalmus maximus]